MSSPFATAPRRRQPEGVPGGGQFDTERKDEPTSTLRPNQPDQSPTPPSLFESEVVKNADHPDGWSFGVPGDVSTDEAGRTLLSTGAGRRYSFDGAVVTYVSRDGIKRASDLSAFSGTERTRAFNHFRHITIVDEAWQSSGRIEIENLSYSAVRLEVRDGGRRSVVGLSFEERPMTVLGIEANGDRVSKLSGEDAKDQIFILRQYGVSEESVYLALEQCNATALADVDYVDTDYTAPQPSIERFGIPAKGTTPLYQLKAEQAQRDKVSSHKENVAAAKMHAQQQKFDARFEAFKAESDEIKARKAEKKARRRGFF